MTKHTTGVDLNHPKYATNVGGGFDSDSAAFAVLGDNFINRSGVLSPRPGYTPTDADYDAIDYLFQEWDYGYEAERRPA